MSIGLIVAMNRLRVIGVNGDLPWRLPKELAYFKSMTLGKAVVMGRKTFESMGKRPLKDRVNAVITRQAAYQADGCRVADSLPTAIDTVRAKYSGELMIIGGARVYAEALPLVNRLYITVVDNVDSGDVYFPHSLAELGELGWQIDAEQVYHRDSKHSSAFTCYQLTRA